MRKVIFGINVSLDGCCDHTKFGLPDEETYGYFKQLMRDADVLVYGRTTYELMVPYWPEMARDHSGDKDENEFADAFGAIKKMVVFSNSLSNTEDEKTEIVHGNIKETIHKLKQEDGKNISTGGVDIPAQLLALGLIDEFHFLVHPVIVGEGRRLFEGANLQQLKLVETKVFKSGVVALRYVKQ